MAKEPVQPQDKYVLRMPDGLRDRIKASAERNSRSMNAEIVAALLTAFPQQPTVEELLDNVHKAIELASTTGGMPYRKTLIEALDVLSERVASGLELDQSRAGTTHPDLQMMEDFGRRFARWRRVNAEGVTTTDLKRELERGLLDKLPRHLLHTAIMQFSRGVPEKALKTLALGRTHFADPESAQSAIVDHIRAFYTENFGDPDESWADMVDDQ
ncbi:Arc family DNA-binding protein [Devosia sp.]|uniref:Arc family DNA-binding protein n=1 Tax=Devosia sp. TaxID=1871048 RepID=UPI001AC8BBD2|nr:Arc family DNA-binding protein [Devosia sp.]MBN9334908.1 Arc family DNA-binding protein [Devosia sp.]